MNVAAERSNVTEPRAGAAARRLTCAAFCGFVVIMTLAGCGKRDGAAPGSRQATPPGDSASSPADKAPSAPPTGGAPSTPSTPAVDPPPSAQPRTEADLRQQVINLADDRLEIRQKAADYIEEIGDEATQIFIHLMKDDAVEVRRGAAFGLLGRFDGQNQEVVDIFAAALGDDDGKIRGISLEAIGNLEGDAFAAHVPTLVALLDPRRSDGATRQKVVQKLGIKKAASRAALPALLNSLKTDPRYGVRAACLGATYRIAEFADDIVPATATTMKEDPEPRLRRLAVGRIGRYGAAAAAYVPHLTAALDDKDATVRAAAAIALGGIGPAAKPAAAKLTSLAQDEAQPEPVRKAATAALARVGK